MISLSIILIVLLISLLFLFKKRWKLLSWFLAAVLIFFLTFKFIRGFFPIPIGVRHFVHLAVPPKDLYEPILVDDFPFHKKGFAKTYSLNVKYLDFYDCGFLSNQKIQTTYRFNGKVKFEFYWKDMKLFEKIITRWVTIGNKKVSLISFAVPLLEKYKDDIGLKITVLEPELALQGTESVKLYVAVSATP